MNKADLTEKLAERGGIPKVRAANYINTYRVHSRGPQSAMKR